MRRAPVAATSAIEATSARIPRGTSAHRGRSGAKANRPDGHRVSLSIMSFGVDLVGFVVAGQGVHDKVDAAPQRELALTGPSGHRAEIADGPLESLAHAAARSSETTMIGETPSPARTGL